ncbi:peptidoglycan D,D-transpeptidase FtsI family protein [Tissierella creatinophila]|uniref:Stage V sporulation protein D n=1 Tax=Tissierella creatinophila DSM 6911 TaxID=1123403 RepID=A0A1U7M5E3_TISCR|nr:penicillin-binding transpeptidase domain-containing protein [Tissierella creatinophila]OLS02533.1 stage V sporulation protein D [Tissierella creatinophila DSM 6911]
MKKKVKMPKENKRIITVLVALCSLLISLVIYISYFQVFKAESIKENSYNKRLWINEENVLRGSILDRNGKVISYSEKEDDKNIRYYPYGRLYSHIIGYSYRQYGKSGLEKEYNNELLDINETNALTEIKNLVLPKSVGNDLKLTIDHSVQEKSQSLLKGKKGSIITMNPKTGEVYSMVSMPDFDSANLDSEWKGIIESSESPLLNRSIQGLYEPGSIFKVITSVAMLETYGIDKNYLCKGKTTVEGYTFKDYGNGVHGKLDLKGGFKNSCNPYFVEKSLMIGKEKLGEVADKFMINKNIAFDLDVKKSKFDYKKAMGKTKIAASSIGQGDVLVTPLNMAMMVSAIANGGEMVKPILVKDVINKNGQTIKTNSTEILSQVSNNDAVEEVKEMMREVVVSGTGKNASIKNVKVSGKTGTAENASGKSHSWFIGFAPYDDPKLAIVVLLEEEGTTGGKGAAPIARDMLIHGLNNISFAEEKIDN